MSEVMTKIAGDLAAPKESSGGKVSPQGGGDFQKLLETVMTEGDDTQLIKSMVGLDNDSVQYKVTAAESLNLSSTQLGEQRTNAIHLLNEVNRSALRMDTLIEMVTTGQHFSSQELLAVQAGVYQIVQEVDLTGQIVSSADRARNSLLNIQI